MITLGKRKMIPEINIVQLKCDNPDTFKRAN